MPKGALVRTLCQMKQRTEFWAFQDFKRLREIKELQGWRCRGDQLLFLLLFSSGRLKNESLSDPRGWPRLNPDDA
eukprot:s447_g20.t1